MVNKNEFVKIAAIGVTGVILYSALASGSKEQVGFGASGGFGGLGGGESLGLGNGGSGGGKSSLTGDTGLTINFPEMPVFKEPDRVVFQDGGINPSPDAVVSPSIPQALSKKEQTSVSSGVKSGKNVNIFEDRNIDSGWFGTTNPVQPYVPVTDKISTPAGGGAGMITGPTLGQKFSGWIKSGNDPKYSTPVGATTQSNPLPVVDFKKDAPKMPDVREAKDYGASAFGKTPSGASLFQDPMKTLREQGGSNVSTSRSGDSKVVTSKKEATTKHYKESGQTKYKDASGKTHIVAKRGK